MTVPAVYSQNLTPVGMPQTLRLADGRLGLERGFRTDEVPLGAVETVRLTYEPRSVAARAFKTSLSVKGGRSVRFTSVSWRGLTRAEEQTAAYRAFVAALLPAVALANPRARFVAGKPAAIWYGIVALAAVAAAGVAMFIGRAFLAGEAGAGLFGCLVAAGGAWQTAPFVLRNRPRPFSPDALPADLLP